MTRIELEAAYGKTWNTTELYNEFTVIAFAAPFVSVIRKLDGVKGSLYFEHSPRFYHSFVAE